MAVMLAWYPVAAFWVFTASVGLADFGQGLERGAAIVVGSIAVVILPPIRRDPTRMALVALALVAFGLLVLRGAQGVEAVTDDRDPTVDIGQTTIASVEVSRNGENLYTADIDPEGKRVDPTGTGWRYFGGFKYGPAMTAIYRPAVSVAGSGGLFLMNLVALVAAAAAAALWAHRSSGTLSAVGAAALVLVPGFTSYELFEAGVNDMVPVALMLLAFAFRSRGSGIVAGILLGLSIGAKLLPAALVILPLVYSVRHRRRSFFLAASGATALIYIPSLINAPKELMANLIVYNVARPLDSTSFLVDFPTVLRGLVTLVALSTVLVILLIIVRRGERLGQATLAGLSCLVIALFLISGPALHRNWLFWIMPLIAVGIEPLRVSCRLFGLSLGLLA